MNKGNIIRLSESDLKDIIKDTANAIISEMAYPASFNMEEFKSLKSFAKRLEYCKSRLPRLGAGSSRVVFRVDDDKVLKLAKNRKGIAQNLAEIDVLTDGYSYSILPDIFDYDENGLFLEAELCRKATEKDFQNIYGVPWGAHCCAVYDEYNAHNGRKLYYNPYSKFQPVVDSVCHGEDNDTMSFFNEVHDYVANHHNDPIGDLTRIANWGIDYEGYFKLVDAGFNKDVAARYYGIK